ncbi:MAG: shikimate dehydrogenase [Caldilineales bacterium]|nr:shikimate dehydrogenase [Caldilineales bacterium]
MLLTGLIGWPLGHSRSPAMHNAAFAASGIDGIYLLMPLPPERVREAVIGLRALGFRGSNVTIPHKQAVLPLMDELSPAARAIGAVNTIVVREDGSLFGDNTDAPGFMADLSGHGITVEELRAGGALLLGAGGSARAVAYALASVGVPIHIHARRPEQAERLIAGLRPHLDDEFLILNHQLSINQSQRLKIKLIINCTPVGMHPHPDASPWPDDTPIQPDQIIYDLVYNPPDTVFMQQARTAHARAINGLGMLVHQGALSWQQWTGQPAPVEAMANALTKSL